MSLVNLHVNHEKKYVNFETNATGSGVLKINNSSSEKEITVDDIKYLKEWLESSNIIEKIFYEEIQSLSLYFTILNKAADLKLTKKQMFWVDTDKNIELLDPKEIIKESKFILDQFKSEEDREEAKNDEIKKSLNDKLKSAAQSFLNRGISTKKDDIDWSTCILLSLVQEDSDKSTDNTDYYPSRTVLSSLNYNEKSNSVSDDYDVSSTQCSTECVIENDSDKETNEYEDAPTSHLRTHVFDIFNKNSKKDLMRIAIVGMTNIGFTIAFDPAEKSKNE
jgi:hypothetical protein